MKTVEVWFCRDGACRFPVGSHRATDGTYCRREAITVSYETIFQSCAKIGQGTPEQSKGDKDG